METAVDCVLGAVGKGVGKEGASLPPQAANNKINNPKKRCFTRMGQIIPQKIGFTCTANEFAKSIILEQFWND